MGEYGEIPPGLPALWAALGQGNRAESLARSVAGSDGVLASARLAGVLAAAGEMDRAERLVGSIRFRSEQAREPYDKAWAWSDLAWLAAASGDRDRAGRLLREAYSAARPVTQPYLQAQLLLAWARVHAAGGDGTRAGEFGDRAWALVTGKLGEPALGQWVLDALPVVVTGAGDLDRGEQFVRTVPGPYGQAQAAAALAVMAAALDQPERAATLLGSITDAYRRARLGEALAAVRAAGTCSSADPYRQARALARFAEFVAAGGPGKTRSGRDWAGPLVRSNPDRNDQALIFAALAAGAAGGGAGPGAALADRAEAIVARIPDPASQPQALVSLAWVAADAGELARAGELANAAERLGRRTGQQVAERGAEAREAATDRGGGRLPDLNGTPNQRKWAESLRSAYVARRWGWEVPAQARAHLARFTEARWWITYRDELDCALGEGAGPLRDKNLPRLEGTERQEDWAYKLRAKFVRAQWPGGIPPRIAAVLAEQTDAHWWIDNRENLAAEVAELAEFSWLCELPEITGAPQQRGRAAAIRDEVVRKYWGNRIPPGVREVLDRLTDAEWWVRNQAGDRRPAAIDRALAAELPARDRGHMAAHSRDVTAHDGACTVQPSYAWNRKAAFDATVALGDLRAGTLPDWQGEPCCVHEGIRDGEREGQEVWLGNRATKVLRESPGITSEQAMAEARKWLAILQRNMDGWG